MAQLFFQMDLDATSRQEIADFLTSIAETVVANPHITGVVLNKSGNTIGEWKIEELKP